MKSRQFTLIEVLVSIIIVAILAGMLIAGVGYAAKRADESKSIALLQQLQIAMDSYKSVNGYYPPASGNEKIGVDNTDGKLVLIINGAKYKFYDKATKRNFMDLPNVDSEGYILDAWDNPVYYKAPGEHNKQAFDIWSTGEDGKQGTAEDDADNVTNWQTVQ